MNAENDAMARIIAKAWADDDFKARLESEPAETLAREGVAVPAGVTVKFVEDTPLVKHLVLPAKPSEGEIAEHDLEDLAGGFNAFTCRWFSFCF